MWKWIGFVALLVMGAGCGGERTTSEYVAEIDQWHAGRIERLRSDTGWLTLVGLHPLKKGANSLGASAEADVTLAGGAPFWLGTIAVTDDLIMFSAHPDAEVSLFESPEQERLTSCVMVTDGAGEPTTLATGSLIMFVIDRQGQLFLRVKDRQAEILKSFTGIDRFPVDARWRLSARLEGGPQTLKVPDVLGNEAESASPGVLVFSVEGQEYRLTPTGDPGEGMFLVFGDASNGKTTYAGGRFLVIDPAAADGTVDLDFNRAYNPPCVFTPYATCPLPAFGNILPVAVTAGEKMYGEAH